MRALIVLAAIVLIMALIGWISFGIGGGRSSINLETEKIRQDTQGVLDSGAEALRETGDAVTDEEVDAAAERDQVEN